MKRRTFLKLCVAACSAPNIISIGKQLGSSAVPEYASHYVDYIDILSGTLEKFMLKDTPLSYVYETYDCLNDFFKQG